jgi:uncharacterized Zn-binding protein involved in type VI secretion
MNNIAIIGTTSSHGGEMVSATGSSFMTKSGAVCRVGDMHSCPIPGHNTTAIVSGGAANTNCMGAAIAINGSVAGCGAVLNGNFATDCSIT